MAEFQGDSLQVYYNTVDISAQMTRAVVNENAPEPEEIDVTHRGDTERQVLEGFPGRVGTNVDVTLWQAEGDAATIMDFAINAKDTLYIYPEGKTHTKPELTLQNARLIDRTETVPFDGADEIAATFNAKNSLTRGTYSSA